MRLVVLTQYFPPEIGAPQTRLAEMIAELGRRGHNIRVITAHPNYPTGRIFESYRRSRGWHEENGIMIRRCWIFPVKGAGMKRLLSYLSFLASSCLPLLTVCRQWRPDYVFIESPPLFLGISGILAHRLAGVPYIFNVADLWPDWAVDAQAISRDSRTYRWAKRLEQLVYSHSAYVTIVVARMRESLHAMNVDDRKILFLPNGASLTATHGPGSGAGDATVAEIRRRCGSRKIVLYAGNHGRFHGLTSLVEAAALSRNRPDVVFLFVGDGSEKQTVVRLAERLELSNAVFTGPVSPGVLDEILQLTTVALASYVCGFKSRSAKMLPAMAAGVPVVMSGEGEGSDLIEEAQAGLVVPPEAPDRIASAVLRLVDDAQLSLRLGHNGKRYVAENLTWGKLVGDWLAQLGSRETMGAGNR